MQNPALKYEVAIDNIKHGGDHATREQADAAALAARTADPSKNVTVREVPAQR